MKVRTITLITALTALVAVAVTAGGANAAANQATPATAPVRATVSYYEFDTLSQAVASGKLDREVLETLRTKGIVDALVTVRYTSPFSGPGPKSFRARAALLEQTLAAKESVAIGAADDEDVEVLRAYDNLPTTFVRFESAEAILDVLNAPDVQFIRANTPVSLSTEQSLNVIRQPQAVAAGRTGSGTYVAVLDTGTDYTRQPFGCTAPGVPVGCKVAGAYETDGDTETSLDEGSFHGTNVAGIVSLVAPGTKIFTYDVFRWSAAANDLRSWPANQLTAINHVVDLKRAGYNVVAINMSLGGDWSTTACNAGINLGLARDWGILPVIAAGNDAQTSTGFRNGIASPACDSNALSVGAVYDSNIGYASWEHCTDVTTAQDQITCFSQTGPNLDILAPGSEITAAGITQSGTSQATPHVAGAVAVLAAAKFGNRLYYRADAQLIENALVNSGPSIYDARIGRPFRRLDLPAAISTLLADGGGGGGDTTAPVVTAPVENFDGPISSSGATVKVSWSATDASGVNEYALYTRTNGGTWVKQSIAPTATSARFVLAFGSRFEFAVQAKDTAGNWSTHAYSSSLTPRVSDDVSWGNFTGWSRYSSPDSYGGTGITGSAAGTSLTHTFLGRDVAFIAPLHAAGGRAHVYCDGAFSGTVDLYSSVTKWRETAYWCRFATAGQQTMKVVVEGTGGRPRVDVDAFAVLQ